MRRLLGGFVNRKFGDLGFHLALAIDNDPRAHETHLLRNVFHEFDHPPMEYNQLLRGELTLDEFYNRYPAEFKTAQEATLLASLGQGESEDQDVHSAIEEALTAGSDHWVLIGGPPCQAYSNVGKSVRKGNAEYNPDQDQRHVLYREYLKVIAEFWPSIFVMENVPDVFSAKFQGRNVWPRYSRRPDGSYIRSRDGRQSNRF